MTKQRYLILFLIGLLCLTACQNGTKDPAAVMDEYTTAINNHDIEAALALVAEDAVYARPNGNFNGRAEIRGFIEDLFARDVQVTLIGERQVDGEEVRWTSSVSIKDPGNLDGPRLQLTNNSRSTVRDGLIVFHTAERAQSQSGGSVFVGTISGTDAFVAVVSDGTNLVAYVCDSESISEWFRGSAAESEVTLTADSGAALQLSLAQETAAGTFTPVGGTAHSFTANKALAPAGLYRADETIDGVAYVGGWIILADGQQRGAVKAGSVVIASPFVDPETDLVVNIPNIGDLFPQFMDPENDL